MKRLIVFFLTALVLVAHASEIPLDLTTLIQRAQSGDAKAQFDLGLKYAQADGVAKNEAEAKKWLRKSADQGYTVAEFVVGLNYFNGEGVKKNYGEALKWFHKSADKGDMYAQAYLGGMYLDGLGVAVNKVQAYKWFVLAAAQGNKDTEEDRTKLEQTMSPAEIAEAKKLSAEWKPKKGN